MSILLPNEQYAPASNRVYMPRSDPPHHYLPYYSDRAESTSNAVPSACPVATGTSTNNKRRWTGGDGGWPTCDTYKRVRATAAPMLNPAEAAPVAGTVEPYWTGCKRSLCTDTETVRDIDRSMARLSLHKRARRSPHSLTGEPRLVTLDTCEAVPVFRQNNHCWRLTGSKPAQPPTGPANSDHDGAEDAIGPLAIVRYVPAPDAMHIDNTIHLPDTITFPPPSSAAPSWWPTAHADRHPPLDPADEHALVLYRSLPANVYDGPVIEELPPDYEETTLDQHDSASCGDAMCVD